jgi:CheY-like chemotaxis protein
LNSDTPRILVIEDDGEQARSIAQALAGHYPPWHLEFAELGKSGLERLAAEPFDVVLLDHRLPDMKGIDLLREIIARRFDVAVIFAVAFGNQAMATEALEAGAVDCIQKSELMYASRDSLLLRCFQAQRIQRKARAAQQDLIREERQSALDQLALTLRHEINNPLAALCAYAELLLTELKEPPELRHRVEQIYQAAKRIQDVVRKTEHVRDELQEYQPGIKMIKLKHPDALPPTQGDKPKPPAD